MAKSCPCIIIFFFFSALIIIIKPLLLIDAQNSGKITVNQSLTATLDGPSWHSPSGDFAFGFHQYLNYTDLFILAIWYTKIPDTIVWYPLELTNGGKPVSQGSTVRLDADAGIVLNDPHGIPVYNTSGLLSGAGFVSYGILNDTGNFALIESNNNNILWQTFDHPRDTLLPTQNLALNGELDSRLSEANFTRGRFQVRLLDGNLVLNTRDPDTGYIYDAYYTNGSSDPVNSTNSGQSLIYDESGSMYILIGNGSKFFLTPDNLVSARDNYHRATLTVGGVLTWYHHPRNISTENAVWSITKSIPDNICLYDTTVGSGACGYNSICSIGENHMPSCKCPPNYSLLDPNDTLGSCRPDFEVGFCEETGQGESEIVYCLVQLQKTDWPLQDYAILNTSSEEACKSSCLNDCFCAAVIFERSKSMCWRKKLPLSNGRTDNSITRNAWLKVSNSSQSLGQLRNLPRSKNKINTAVSVLLGISAFGNFILLSAIVSAIFFNYRKNLKKFEKGHSKTMREFSNVNNFSYQELVEATNQFKEELGRGAFGIVYKGKIEVGGPPIFVAVKKLDRLSKDADKEFKTEVNVIGQTHHKNLVRLVGFCKEEDQRLLVYEYMSNGSLADYLFDDLRPSWTSRVQIAEGIARGLVYLHEECSTQIIHCDIKPQNILLDDNYNARIADFGLAKLLVLNQTHTNTAIRGTKGYVAPEWFRNKPVTVKVDVYSFGVLLMEIICCRRNVRIDLAEDEAAILTDWALDCYWFNKLDSLVTDDMEALSDRPRLKRFVMVALWCIQEEPSLRPTMKMITQMLEGLTEVPNPPYPVSLSVTTI